MSMNTQIDLSKLCGRKLSDEEAARIREVASNLDLRDDDAIWQLLAAMEYQRTYYEKLPKSIAEMSDRVVKNTKEMADLQIAKSQAELTENIIKEAKNLSIGLKFEILLPYVIIGILIMVVYSCLMLWAGGNIKNPKYVGELAILYQPAGLVIAGLFLLLGTMLGTNAFFAYIDYRKKMEWSCDKDYKWLIYLLLSIPCFGAWYWLFFELII